jgi:hypothetical protein
MWSSAVRGKVVLAVTFVGPGVRPCAPPSPADCSGLLLHRFLIGSLLIFPMFFSISKFVFILFVLFVLFVLFMLLSFS